MIMHPPPGDPGWADQTSACVQLASYLLCDQGCPLFSHSHLNALSAASVVLQMGPLNAQMSEGSGLWSLADTLVTIWLADNTDYLVNSDRRMMSGLKVVVMVLLGNFSCLSWSTSSCQSLAEARIAANVFAEGLSCSPALIASAMAWRTWLSPHQYQPSASAVVQQLRMCSRHACVFALWKFIELRSTLYTAWMRCIQ